MQFIEFKRTTVTFQGNFDQANAKTIKTVVQTIAIALFNQIAKKYNSKVSIHSGRAARLLIALPLAITLFLGGCTQPEAITPETDMNSSVREAASVLSVDHFDQDRVADFWNQELHTDYAGRIDSEQRRLGQKAMRFSWKPSQYDGTNKSCHAELATDALPKSENERWYSFSMYLPSATMANDDQVANIMQWHGLPDPGTEGTVPPIALELKNNALTLYCRASNKSIDKFLQVPTSQKIIHTLGMAQYDRWVDYVVHIKWDATGNTGKIQVWQDGSLKVDEQNLSIGYVSARNYWKVGLYCWTGKSAHAERTIYYDEVRIGNASATYDDMKPGQSTQLANQYLHTYDNLAWGANRSISQAIPTTSKHPITFSHRKAVRFRYQLSTTSPSLMIAAQNVARPPMDLT